MPKKPAAPAAGTLQSFFYPALGTSVLARSLEDADAIAAKLLAPSNPPDGQ